jgi:hypothetical protein
MSRAGHQTAIGFPVDGGYQSISFTAASASAGSALGSQTYRVMLYATQDCHISFDGSSATTSDFFLPASFPVMFMARPGATVSAIRASADGALHISEITQ